jgi:hypothetical protein
VHNVVEGRDDFWDIFVTARMAAIAELRDILQDVVFLIIIPVHFFISSFLLFRVHLDM